MKSDQVKREERELVERAQQGDRDAFGGRQMSLRKP